MLMSKVCRTCKVDQPSDAFYVHWTKTEYTNCLKCRQSYSETKKAIKEGERADERDRRKEFKKQNKISLSLHEKIKSKATSEAHLMACLETTSKLSVIEKKWFQRAKWYHHSIIPHLVYFFNFLILFFHFFYVIGFCTAFYFCWKRLGKFLYQKSNYLELVDEQQMRTLKLSDQFYDRIKLDELKSEGFLRGGEWRGLRAEFIQKNLVRNNKLDCHYCKRDAAIDTTVDHLFARSTHPHMALDENNLVICCRLCNSTKGAKTEKEFRDYLDTRTNTVRISQNINRKW